MDLLCSTIYQKHILYIWYDLLVYIIGCFNPSTDEWCEHAVGCRLFYTQKNSGGHPRGRRRQDGASHAVHHRDGDGVRPRCQDDRGLAEGEGQSRLACPKCWHAVSPQRLWRRTTIVLVLDAMCYVLGAKYCVLSRCHAMVLWEAIPLLSSLTHSYGM